MKKIMITIEAVSRFRWNAELGANLKGKRTSIKMGRPVMAQKVGSVMELPIGGVSNFKPDSVSPKYIENLENGIPQSVALETLRAIAAVLGVEVDELLITGDTIEIIL